MAQAIHTTTRKEHTMSMSRKDYVALAEVLGDCLSAYAPSCEDEAGAIRYTIARVADRLALNNERFDPERFIAHAKAHSLDIAMKAATR